MSDLPMTLLDLDSSGLDPMQPAPAELVQFLYDNSRSGYLTLWSQLLAMPDGGARINRWIGDALAVYHARTLQTQMAPEGDKPSGDNVTEVTYSGSTAPAAPVCIDAPYVNPTVAQIGYTLSCTVGNWGNEPTSYAHAWSGAGSSDMSTYVVDAADAGTTITCTVTATSAGGSTASPPSNGVVIAGMAERGERRVELKPDVDVDVEAKEQRREYPKEPKPTTTGSVDHRRR